MHVAHDMEAPDLKPQPAFPPAHLNLLKALTRHLPLPVKPRTLSQKTASQNHGCLHQGWGLWVCMIMGAVLARGQLRRSSGAQGWKREAPALRETQLCSLLKLLCWNVKSQIT